MTVPPRILSPIGRSAKELVGYVPGAVTNGGVTAPQAIPGSPSALIPLSVEGLSGAVEIDTFDGNEASPLVRVWADFTGYNLVRLQGHVAEAGAAGQKFAAKYFDGADWQWLGTDELGASGPVLDVSAAGDIRGKDVLLVSGAQGEVLVGLFKVTI